MASPTTAASDGAPPVLSRTGTALAVALAGGWLWVAALIVRHAIFVSHDSMISYAHVWWISKHMLPLHMPVLDHGQAYAFPYGFVPWSTAALLRPLFGDRIVTVWFVVGAAGVFAATFWAFPEVRKGWWAAAVLVNPALVAGLLIGQQPFLWASALLLVAIGAWRRDKKARATVLAALAQATHPAIVLPLAALLVAGVAIALPRERRSLLGHYALSVLLASPAVWLVLASPVVADTSALAKVAAFFETIGPRCLVIAVPVALALAARFLGGRGWRVVVGPAAVAVLVASNAVLWRPLQLPWAYRGLWRDPNTSMLRFMTTPAFVPGTTYRLLRIADGKIGMYQLIQHGARLDSEFFPESMDKRSWPSPAAYGAFLRGRGVQYVMVWGGFDLVYRTNEHALLRRMAAHPGCTGAPVRVELARVTRPYDLFRISPCP